MNFSKDIRHWIIACCLLISFPIVAQAQLTLDAEFRPRTEYRNGYGTLRTADTNPAFFTSQRSRLTLNYQSDLYKIRFSGQDVRVWGDVEQLGDTPNVNIHEAWAEFNVSERFDVKLGRQELIYDDHRLLGSVNWTQQARSHDALILKYHHPGTDLKIDIGGAYNQDSENLLGNTYTLNNYKVLSYIWLHKNFEAFNASIFGLTDGFEQKSGSTNFRYTYGTHLTYSNDGLELSGSLYLQKGDDGLRRNISAQMYAAKAGYTFNSLHLVAGFDYLSGGSANDNNPQSNAFNTLYATNHKFYGNMDYFLNIPADTRYGGLQDIYLQADYDLTAHSSLSLTYHYFALAESIADPLVSGQSLDKPLGSELDFNLTHNFNSEIVLKAGYSLLTPSDSLEHIKLTDAKSTQHWGWVMLSLSPNFVK